MKKKILFVDNEENVIRGIRRSFYNMREEWDMYFATNANDALKFLEEEKIELIVSEMKLYTPQRQDLLEYVKANYQNIIRVVLSGYTDEKSSLLAMRCAHQYLLKPCEGSVLKDKIIYALSLYSFIHNENLQKFIAGVNELPVLPQVYFTIEKELSSEAISTKKIAAIIAQDPVLVAKVLQLVNSAFFGLPTKITDVLQAINLLGLSVVKTLVIYLSLMNDKISAEHQKYQYEIWQHSLKMAQMAKTIARSIKDANFNIDDVYVAGLLHDIGKIVMLQYPDYLSKVVANTAKLNVSYYEAERIVYKTSHAEIGAYLLGLWGLPKNVVEAVANHHSYIDANDKLSINNILRIAEKVARIEKIEDEELLDIFHKNVEGQK